MNERERNSDYLWDKSGEPDPEVARLEAMLGTLRHRAPAPAWPEEPRPVASFARPRRWSRPLLLAAAAAAVVIGAFATYRLGGLAGVGGGWRLAGFDGAAAVDDATAARGSRLRPGQEITTQLAGRARLLLPLVGEVEIGPGSTVRVLADRRDAQSLELVRGSLLARTWAPPKLFSIETPVGRAVDYGCAYALDVAADGGTHLRVEMGWVALEVGGREALVPAGASVRAGARDRIGTPVWLDAPRDFRAAVERFDDAPRTSSARAQSLADLLDQARERDALTLWHLLGAADAAERESIMDRLAGIVAPPPGVRREALLAADRVALRAWFEALGLGDVPGWN